MSKARELTRHCVLNAAVAGEIKKTIALVSKLMSMVGQYFVITVGGQMEGVEISSSHLEWFEKRGISEAVIHTGPYSGRHQQTGDRWEVVPDLNGSILVYPYFRNGVVVNEKYRGPQKKFYQKLGGEKCFWNVDILNDPSLQDGSQALVITEGENDALSCIEAGYPFVVSVPDGAPPPRKGNTELEDVDIEHDDKFSYIHHDWDLLKKIKRITIAVDSDEPGKRLAEELVRRLGRVRCQFIEYPPECKDLNEVLVKYGGEGVLGVLQAAKEYPVSGVYRLSDLPPEPDNEAVSTGWGHLDMYLKVVYPAFMVVTGTAGSGKTTWTNQMVAQLNLLHGWKVGIASFEMRINPYVANTLRGAYRMFRSSHSRPDPINEDIWINDNFAFIAPEPGHDDDNSDIEWLIEKAEIAVIRHGIRVLVIDPWNELEHAFGKRESHTDYIGRAIRALKRFGKKFECLVIVVAHPTKWAATRKEPHEITLYDISDSSHFKNKADFGVVIHRHVGGNSTTVKVDKVRNEPAWGCRGSIMLSFDGETFA